MKLVEREKSTNKPDVDREEERRCSADIVLGRAAHDAVKRLPCRIRRNGCRASRQHVADHGLNSRQHFRGPGRVAGVAHGLYVEINQPSVVSV